MKLLAFEVRADEKEYFQKMREQHQLVIDEREDILTLENVDQCQGYDAITCLGMSSLNRDLLSELKKRNIFYIATRSIGYNHIDLKSAEEFHQHICNVSYAPDSVAEYTVMLMLLVMRKYKPALYRQNVNDYSLEGLMGKTMSSMTIGIMGTGRIGKTVIQILSSFGCRILACSQMEDIEIKEYAEYVDQERLLRQSDIISLHMPLTEENRYFVNDESLKMMKNGVIIVNTARGELMNVETLIKGIESEKIGALAMDVFENESDIYHKSRLNDIISNQNMAYLRQFPNVVMTQHMAFYTECSVREMVTHAIEGLLKMSAGETYTMELTGR